MEFLDARRLTGPSLLFDAPGSILDVRCDAAEAQRLIPVWKKHVQRMLQALGWSEERDYAAKTLVGGVSLGFTAPIDALYAASEINEWAWAASHAELNATAEPDFDEAVARLRQAILEEANPRLLALESAAREHDVVMLWDDDEASLGLGRHALTWPVRELPRPESIDWSAHDEIPLCLVTGTNGKTTTVRMTARILHAAGHSVGLSSTDYIAINDRVVDRDDWAGPGGARNVLRQTEIDAAILETARGGLLRRGLGVTKADAALITNIARDHLGDFGSRDLDELLDCKWIVSRAVVNAGRLVLNADDDRLVAKAHDYPGALVWFSLESDNPVVRRHAAGGGTAFLLDGEELVRHEAGTRETICRVVDIPIAMRGAARYNVANALAASALTWSMGVETADIRRGLESMSQDANPGRGNLYDIDGYRVLVDFAHNPHALQALLETANRLQPRRKALCFGQAGDRPDELIRELAGIAWDSGLDQVFVSELAKYHRGRAHGDVHGVIRDEMISRGARPEQVAHCEEEIESLDSALAWAEPGDLVIMIALERSPELYAKLEALS
jgi:UDP-N-acetylmuramyl tripeptide synthase